MPPTTLLTACIAITLVTLKANVCFDGDAGDQFWLSPEIAANSDLQNCIHGKHN